MTQFDKVDMLLKQCELCHIKLTVSLLALKGYVNILEHSEADRKAESCNLDDQLSEEDALLSDRTAFKKDLEIYNEICRNG